MISFISFTGYKVSSCPTAAELFTVNTKRVCVCVCMCVHIMKQSSAAKVYNRLRKSEASDEELANSGKTSPVPHLRDLPLQLTEGH